MDAAPKNTNKELTKCFFPGPISICVRPNFMSQKKTIQIDLWPANICLNFSVLFRKYLPRRPMAKIPHIWRVWQQRNPLKGVCHQFPILSIGYLFDASVYFAIQLPFNYVKFVKYAAWITNELLLVVGRILPCCILFSKEQMSHCINLCYTTYVDITLFVILVIKIYSMIHRTEEYQHERRKLRTDCLK